jgi:hypothetical protein
MTPTPVPPPVAEALLRLSVRDAEWRDAVAGDLREELAAVAAARGPEAATRWYWRQAVPLACRFAISRIVPAWRPARRRLAVADIEQTSTLGAGWSREVRHAWRALAQRPGLSGSSSARWPWRWRPTRSSSVWPTRSTCGPSASPT